MRDKSPPDKDNKKASNQGDTQTHGGKIEHAERCHTGTLPKGGDNDIGRRADQGDQSAQEGTEGNWHEIDRRRQVPASCDADHDGHEKGECAHVVHKCRRDHNKAYERPQLGGQTAAEMLQPPGDHIHNPGLSQAPANHENSGHGHHCRMSEPLEGLLTGHDASAYHDQKAHERHQIVPPPSIDEKHQGEHQCSENDHLIHHVDSFFEKSLLPITSSITTVRLCLIVSMSEAFVAKAFYFMALIASPQKRDFCSF